MYLENLAPTRLNGIALRRVRELERELGIVLIACEAQPGQSQITGEELRLIRQAEHDEHRRQYWECEDSSRPET